MLQLFKNSLKYKDENGCMKDSGVLFASEKEKEWEHIETITIEEDGVKDITRTQEPDETLYNFKKMIVFVHHPIAEKSGRTGIIINGDDNASYLTNNLQALQAEHTTDSVYRMEIIKDIMYGESTMVYGYSADYASTDSALGNITARKLVKLNAINTIKYRSLNGYTLPIGTTMDIYAIRA